jgi:hypothetical protein
MRFTMKKTLSMLAAVAAAAVMYSSSANALCVSVKTNLQTKDNNSASTRQNCSHNVTTNAQRGKSNEFSAEQTGKENRVFSNQGGDRNRLEAKQTGTGSGSNDVRATQRDRRR